MLNHSPEYFWYGAGHRCRHLFYFTLSFYTRNNHQPYLGKTVSDFFGAQTDNKATDLPGAAYSLYNQTLNIKFFVDSFTV